MLTTFALTIGGIPIGVLIARLMRGKPASNLELAAGLLAVIVAAVIMVQQWH